MSKKTYIEGFCKKAASKGVDPVSLAGIVSRMQKMAGFVEDVKNAIDNAAAHYAQLSDGTRMAISAAGAGAIGAGIGRHMSKKKNKTKGTILGALIGAGAGAMANPAVNAPDWLKLKAMSGTGGLMDGKTPSEKKEITENLLGWLAKNTDGPARDVIQRSIPASKN